MFMFTEFSRRTQRVTCMLLSVFVVVAALAAGAHGVDSMAHPDYSVTVTQL